MVSKPPGPPWMAEVYVTMITPGEAGVLVLAWSPNGETSAQYNSKKGINGKWRRTPWYGKWIIPKEEDMKRYAFPVDSGLGMNLEYTRVVLNEDGQQCFCIALDRASDLYMALDWYGNRGEVITRTDNTTGVSMESKEYEEAIRIMWDIDKGMLTENGLNFMKWVLTFLGLRMLWSRM